MLKFWILILFSILINIETSSFMKDEKKFDSIDELLDIYKENSCYIKGNNIGSGRYSNVYLCWKITPCILIKSKNSSSILIDPDYYGISQQEISLFKGTPVALKEFKNIQEWKIIREVSILRRLNKLKNRNLSGRNAIINLLDIISYPNFTKTTEPSIKGYKNVAIILEYINNEQFYSLVPKLKYGDLQNYMRQLLEGLDYANSLGIFHRDIKPQNIIINRKKKELKIIDWGLAEFYSTENIDFSPRVASKSYKAPELLLGLRKYDYSVDLWSVGCLFSQMLFRLGTSKTNFFTRLFTSFPENFVGIYSRNSPNPETLFPGWDNEDQIVKIGSLLGGDNLHLLSRKYNGTIPENIIKNLNRTRKLFETTRPWYTDPRTFDFLLTDENSDLVTIEALDLLSKFIVLDYRYRISSREALGHPFFTKKFTNHTKLIDYKGERMNILWKTEFENEINFSRRYLKCLNKENKTFQAFCELIPNLREFKQLN